MGVFMEMDRVENVKNRVFEQTIGFGRNIPQSMSTNSEHTYRVTGMSQIRDIIITGYIRPKEKVKGGHNLEVFWTHGGENLFYHSGSPILEVSSERVKDGQIGALTIHDLTAVYIFDSKLNRYVNRLDDILAMYNGVDLDNVNEGIKL